MKTRFSLWLLLTAICGGIVLVAQGITGDLAIQVSDPNGAAVANAKLTLRNVQENTSMQAQTDQGGTYVFSELKPGVYELDISASGFETQHIRDINVQLAQRAAVNTNLTLGTVSQTIEVSAAADTLLNAESATEGQVMQEHTIESLPLNGRNFIQLAQLTAGAAPIGTGTSPATTWTGRTDQTIS
ncbi:MAG: carboxypeptidase regulatory-like domain-containing protein, partial [Acidobacteriaceae bacterium]|nr:carboxypeptidase regulatory-like domain-containing protein [Acidobacteriaceae bacterium]